MKPVDELVGLARHYFQSRDDVARQEILSRLDADTVHAMVSDFGRRFSLGEFSLIRNIQLNDVTLYASRDLIILVRHYISDSQFLYMSSASYLECFLKVSEGAELTTYDVEGAGPRAFRLAQSLEQPRAVRREARSLRDGDVIEKPGVDVIYDLRSMAGSYSIKLIHFPGEPYDIVFSRETLRVAGAYQVSFANALACTMLELAGELDCRDLTESISRLVDSQDPVVVWDAVKALDVLGAEEVPALLYKLSASPVPLLSAAANAAILSRSH